VCCFAALFVLEISGGNWKEGCGRMRTCLVLSFGLGLTHVVIDHEMMETKKKVREVHAGHEFNDQKNDSL